MAKFELYQDAKREYRWRLKSGNGIIIATGGEGYTSRAGAYNGIEAVKRDAAAAGLEDKSGSGKDASYAGGVTAKQETTVPVGKTEVRVTDIRTGETTTMTPREALQKVKDEHEAQKKAFYDLSESFKVAQTELAQARTILARMMNSISRFEDALRMRELEDWSHTMFADRLVQIVKDAHQGSA